MKNNRTLRIFGSALAAALFLSAFPAAALADTVKTKDGKQYDGEITFEAADVLKIKVQKSATISETVTILKKDVAEVIKSAPDDVEMANLKKLVPTPSLMPASAYRDSIAKGPAAFLKSYPDSRHKPEVEKILQVLEEDLAKVEKGFLKLEGDWLSPQHQRDFKALIESRILNLGIKQKAQQANFIGALRDFEKMEGNYFGTPSYPESVRAILGMLPIMGQRMQLMAKEANYLNEDFEKKLLLMPEQNRERTRLAREREEAELKKAFEADKKSGIKWYRVNQRDEEDLKNYIQMVAAEITRLQNLNLTALSQQAGELVKVDEMIAEGKLGAAREKLKEVGAMSTASGGASSSRAKKGYVSRSGGTSRRTTSSSRTKSKTNYIIKLQEKIEMKEAAIAETKAQEQSTAEGAQATKLIRADAVVAVETEGVENAEEVEPKSTGGNNALEGFISSGGSKKVDQGKGDAKSTGKSKTPTRKTTRPPVKKTPPKSDADEKEEPKRTTASGGGGFNMMYVVWGVTGLLIVSVVVMKVTGIGGAKG